MGVGPLRVWNDDRVAPGTGFDPHPHRDMEIITYVRRGAVTHRDDLGNEGRTEAGDVQVMSAGTGIVHAEYNRDDEPLELFQIWIQPRTARPDAALGAARVPVRRARRLPGDARIGPRRRRRRAADRSGRSPARRDACRRPARPAHAGPGPSGLPGRARAAASRSTASRRSRAMASSCAARATVTIEALDDAEILLADLP